MLFDSKTRCLVSRRLFKCYLVAELVVLELPRHALVGAQTDGRSACA